MPEYRLFHVNGDGDSIDVEEFFATSDETALNFAVSRTGSHSGELWSWSDRRFVAIITRSGTQAGSAGFGGP